MNAVVDRMYVTAGRMSAAVRSWPSRPRYVVTMFLGTRIEVYIMAIGFAWLHDRLPAHGLAGAMLLAAFFAALRVYPRFCTMWIQSTYPLRLLVVELVNGTIGTFVVLLALYMLW